MIAGRMRTRLTVWRPERKRDGFGQETAKWVEAGWARAERVKYSGRLRVEADEAFPAYDAVYNVRIRHAIGEGWRVRECGCTPMMRVSNVVPNHERGFLTLYCRKENN